MVKTCSGFNPTLVRLRPQSELKNGRRGWGFNPTLVRLRPSRSRSGQLSQSGFQSHAGSIEAEDAQQHPHQAPIVSIPRWFD